LERGPGGEVKVNIIMWISPNDAVYYGRLTKLILQHLKHMKFYIFITAMMTVLPGLMSFAQDRITVDEYIEIYKDIAIGKMEEYRIPASITLAQGILESDCGNSPLAVNANNHFGIKCHKEWTGKTYYQDDDEANECFRSYKNPVESYQDHSYFLTTRERYKLLFELEITDYKAWAHGLKQAGYATNPRYPDLLIKIIEENGLAEFDMVSGRRSAVAGQQSAVGSRQSTVSGQEEEVPVLGIFGVGPKDRMIFTNNGVKLILAREGDDFYKIATDFEIYTWQLFKYNDMTRDDAVVKGKKVYLEKKRRRGERDSYTAVQGDNMYSVSQEFGIRLNALCRLNQKDKNDELAPGELLRLR
jgi:hypothetical protein